MEVGIVLLHDNHPGRGLNQAEQPVEICSRTGAAPNLAGAVRGCRARPECAFAESQVCRYRAHQMKQHQDGSQEAGKNGHRSLRERLPQLSIHSQIPNSVPTGSAITTNWLITSWRTSGSMLVLIGSPAALNSAAAIMVANPDVDGNPGWIVLAWLVVALASAAKFWSITRPYRNKTDLTTSDNVDE